MRNSPLLVRLAAAELAGLVATLFSFSLRAPMLLSFLLLAVMYGLACALVVAALRPPREESDPAG